MRTTLVTCAELAAHPGWRVFDCRYDLAVPDAGLSQYRAAHVPRALHAHIDRDLSAARTGHNGRHPLPDPADFASWVGRQGLKPGQQVVVYDAAGGMFAARLWWMLRWIGHRAVAVLDGGWDEWTRLGLPTTPVVAAFPRGDYRGTADERALVSAGQIEAGLGQPGTLIVDARARERYEGRIEPIDARKGHIPGALNRHFALNLDADGRFKAPERLRAEWLELLGGQDPAGVIAQCGSGVTACHNLLAMEIAGLGGARLYPGSWSEWCSDPSRPVETGAAPR